MKSSPRRELPRIGWREWLALPDLGVEAMKVKVDTGARTSALHAFRLERETVKGEPWVRFVIHPFQRTDEPSIAASAPLVDERWVRSSSGRETLRPVIHARAVLGEHREWNIEITLIRRDLMGFRMLLGRQAIRNRFLVDAGRSYRFGRRSVK